MLRPLLWATLIMVAPASQACRPSPEWIALSVEERVKRLYEEASLVAHIRIVRILPQDLEVTVIESFKGSKSFKTVGIDPTSCRVSLQEGEEAVVFLDEHRRPDLLNTVRGDDIRRGLTVLRKR